MGPGGGPTKMYENPRVSRPLPLIWGWVFDAAAPALVPALGGIATGLAGCILLRQMTIALRNRLHGNLQALRRFRTLRLPDSPPHGILLKHTPGPPVVLVPKEHAAIEIVEIGRRFH